MIAAWPLDRWARAKRRDGEAMFVAVQQLIQQGVVRGEPCWWFPAQKLNVAR